jgi:glycosyltransferase involved in cell wall biosynthesis
MRRPLNILALNWRCTRHLQAGGCEVNLFEQARRWVAGGHRVTVFCADPGREHAPARDETMDGVRVIRRGGRFTVYLLAALFALLNSRRYDRVLDVANGIPFFTPLFTAKPVALLVHHVHDRQWFAEFSYPLAVLGWFLEHRVVPRLYRRTAVMAVSPTTRDALVNTGIEWARIRIVYNGVTPPAESEVTGYSGERRIVYVGRVKRYKRLDLLVRMVPALREEFPDIRLDIAGSGDAAPAIEALVEELGLRDCVAVRGFVDEEEKAEILSRAAVFATPSIHEGWGLTVIEANGRGCPAVAYDVPGLRTAIRHGETGLLAEDDAGFRRALSLFLGDGEARRRYSEAAREWAGTFSWDSCARQTLEILLASGSTGVTRP